MTPDLISVAFAAVLVAAAFLDMRTGKIPNWLIGIGAVIFVGKVILFPDSVDLMWQLVFAGIIFAFGIALFVAGATGAGAVKLVSITALFMPMDYKGTLALILLAAIIVSLILFGFLRGAFGGEDSAWSVLRKRVVPLAVPIGVTGLCGLFLL